jgi:hypothetical protein
LTLTLRNLFARIICFAELTSNYHTGNQFSAIFIQVKNLSSSPSDAEVAILTNELKKFAIEALQGSSGGGSSGASSVPFATMVMLVGSGEKDEEELVRSSSKRWSVHSDDEGNIHVVLRGLTPCQRFISKELQKCLRSCDWSMTSEVQDHFKYQVGLTEEDASLAAAGMKSTCF